MTLKDHQKITPFNPTGPVDLQKILAEIKVREEKIRKIAFGTHEYSMWGFVNNKVVSMMNPDYESQLMDDIHMMAHFKEVNVYESKLVNNLRDLLKAHAIPLDTSGHPGQINERINLTALQITAQNDKIRHQQALRLAQFQNNEIKHGRDLQAIDEQKIVSEIAECERIIRAVESIKKELVN
jgi:hypothetical protein